MRFVASCVLTLLVAACSSGQTGLSSEVSAESNGQTGSHGSAQSGSPREGASDASLGGCTYTQGYWKNHPSAWPVMSLTIGGVVYSQQQLLALFGDSPGGDASLILAHQLIAALLNVANGAVPSPAVQQAINDAQTWMAANKNSNAALPYGVPAGSAAGNEATALTDTLDGFNSGMAGTPHCGEGGSSSSSGGGSGSGSESGGGSSSSSSGGSSCVGSGGACTTSTDCCAGTTCFSGTCQQLVH